MERGLIAAYTLPQASHFTRVAQSTLRSWFMGSRAGDRVYKPVLTPAVAQKGRVRLSFVNVVEANMLASLRRIHDVKLPKIRTAVRKLQELLEQEHPLASARLIAHQSEIFVDVLGELKIVSSDETDALKQEVDLRAARVVYHHDYASYARTFFPLLGRREIQETPKAIEITPDRAFGRPVIANTGIPAQEVIERFHAGDPIETLVTDFELTAGQVEEAIRAFGSDRALAS
jgi:uncharacterized protein (DUF433 family)